MPLLRAFTVLLVLTPAGRAWGQTNTAVISGVLADPNLPGGQRTPERWFDPNAFALPDQFTFGTARRNSVVGPGFANTTRTSAGSSAPNRLGNRSSAHG